MLVTIPNCWMKVMNIWNVICVSLMTTFQQVMTVYVSDLHEFIKY